ncbi:hypothetical protein OIU79_002083 [Salix purpurea]|uniref:Uncharacterized protein n=1 Tax=Salix purpurea TaxID=77065 RepID=A0A9Q0UR89_SALPP|nr:hypothetical protein OIU79_002083 [Salix purpurea]
MIDLSSSRSAFLYASGASEPAVYDAAALDTDHTFDDTWKMVPFRLTRDWTAFLVSKLGRRRPPACRPPSSLPLLIGLVQGKIDISSSRSAFLDASASGASEPAVYDAAALDTDLTFDDTWANGTFWIDA